MHNRDYSHPALTGFASIADALCTVIGKASGAPALQLDAIHRLLSEVYAAALRLPSTSVLFDDNAWSEQDHEASHSADEPSAPGELPPGLTQLADFLGMRRFYREIFDPYSEPTETECTGDIIDDIDDIGDIYRDLSGGLVPWREGNSGEALWEWRFGFERHWGEHATSALRAIFALSAWRDVPWPSGPG